VATSATSLAKTGKFGDLRRRLVFLLLALVVYRIGAHIPVPGIDPSTLEQLFSQQEGGILSLFNMFSGGALSRFTVFALGHHALHFRVDHHATDDLRGAHLHGLEKGR
jgi:preprotein translocase subunit SecY